MLRRSPGFALVAILTLALGIGANTAIFSIINGVLLRGLPVAAPDRLFTLASGTSPDGRWTYGVWQQLQRRADLFGGMSASALLPFHVTHRGVEHVVDGLYASGDLFNVLGVRMFAGRPLSPADDTPGGGEAGPVALISHRFWQTQFAGASDAIGAPITVRRTRFTVVGVLPPEFYSLEIGRRADVVLPLSAEALIAGEETWTAGDNATIAWLQILVRPKPDQTSAAVTARLRALQPEIREAALPAGPPSYIENFLKDPFTVQPISNSASTVRTRYTQPLITLFIVVALVLLIACANLANLMLARAASRRKEISIRLALGAARGHLVRQLLVEGLVLSSLGAALGLLLATWASQALVSQLSARAFTVVLDLSIDWRVMLFTAAVTIVAALLFGIAPVLRAMHIAPGDALREQTRGAGGSSRGRLPDAVLVAQMALSVVLVVAAGLFVWTFVGLVRLPVGFDTARVLVVPVEGSVLGVDDDAERTALIQRLVDAAAAVPGVALAAASAGAPGGELRMPTFVDGGVAKGMSDRDRRAMRNEVTPGWFKTYGTPLRAGRDFTTSDTMSAPPVMIVNEAFVRRFYPKGGALGETLNVSLGRRGEIPAGSKTIVGIVADAVYGTVREPVPPTIYTPVAQPAMSPAPRSFIHINVRSNAGPPIALGPKVEEAILKAVPDLDVEYRSLGDRLDAAIAQERLVASLSGVFGLLAILLAGIGLYGITAFNVNRRRGEIGIRLALGASTAGIMWMVLGRTLMLTAIGLMLGLAGAASVTRYLKAMLFGITPLDATTFVAVAVIFLAVAMFAALVPGIRATRVDPLTTLRSE